MRGGLKKPRARSTQGVTEEAMRIDPTTLTEFSLDTTAAGASPRARRIRETLQAGLYTVDLDRLAGRIVDRR